jgi:hypothetical protein
MIAALQHLRKHSGLLFIACLTLLTYLAQYSLRWLDDNRLTRWQWCFQGGVSVTVFFAITAGAVFAYFLALAPARLGRRGVLLFFLAFAASCLFWQEPEVILDASRYFTQAKHLELYGVRHFLGEWGGDIQAWTDMPLVPFLYGVVFKVFGESRVCVQLLTSLLFALTVLLTSRIGGELWDEDIGFYGGVFLLGIPYLYTQTPLMLVDVPATFFLFLAVFLFLRALKRGGTAVFLAGAAIFLAFYSKYSTWLMLSVCAVIATVFAVQERRKRETLSRTALAVSFSILLIGVLFLYKFNVFADQIHLLIAYQKPGLQRWGESFVSTFLFQIHPFVTGLALVSAWAAIRKRDPKYLIVAWLVVLFAVLQIKRSRYSIMVFPMVTLAASYGLCQFRDGRIRRCIAACVVTSSLAVALFSYLPFLQKLSAANIQAAGAFLNGMKERDVEVFSLMPSDPVAEPAVSVPLLDIFTRKHILYHYRSELPPRMRERIAASSLRFTLGYINPRYYRDGPGAEDSPAVAVISGSVRDVLPPAVRGRLTGYGLVKAFDAAEGIFRYATVVRVYERDVPGDRQEVGRGARSGPGY